MHKRKTQVLLLRLREESVDVVLAVDVGVAQADAGAQDDRPGPMWRHHEGPQAAKEHAARGLHAGVQAAAAPLLVQRLVAAASSAAGAAAAGLLLTSAVAVVVVCHSGDTVEI